MKLCYYSYFFILIVAVVTKEISIDTTSPFKYNEEILENKMSMVPNGLKSSMLTTYTKEPEETDNEKTKSSDNIQGTKTTELEYSTTTEAQKLETNVKETYDDEKETVLKDIVKENLLRNKQNFEKGEPVEIPDALKEEIITQYLLKEMKNPTRILGSVQQDEKEKVLKHLLTSMLGNSEVSTKETEENQLFANDENKKDSSTSKSSDLDKIIEEDLKLNEKLNAKNKDLKHSISDSINKGDTDTKNIIDTDYKLKKDMVDYIKRPDDNKDLKTDLKKLVNQDIKLKKDLMDKENADTLEIVKPINDINTENIFSNTDNPAILNDIKNKSLNKPKLNMFEAPDLDVTENNIASQDLKDPKRQVSKSEESNLGTSPLISLLKGEKVGSSGPETITGDNKLEGLQPTPSENEELSDISKQRENHLPNLNDKTDEPMNNNKSSSTISDTDNKANADTTRDSENSSDTKNVSESNDINETKNDTESKPNTDTNNDVETALEIRKVPDDDNSNNNEISPVISGMDGKGSNLNDAKYEPMNDSKPIISVLNNSGSKPNADARGESNTANPSLFGNEADITKEIKKNVDAETFTEVKEKENLQSKLDNGGKAEKEQENSSETTSLVLPKGLDSTVAIPNNLKNVHEKIREAKTNSDQLPKNLADLTSDQIQSLSDQEIITKLQQSQKINPEIVKKANDPEAIHDILSSSPQRIPFIETNPLEVQVDPTESDAEKISDSQVNSSHFVLPVAELLGSNPFSTEQPADARIDPRVLKSMSDAELQVTLIALLSSMNPSEMNQITLRPTGYGTFMTFIGDVDLNTDLVPIQSNPLTRKKAKEYFKNVAKAVNNIHSKMPPGTDEVVKAVIGATVPGGSEAIMAGEFIAKVIKQQQERKKKATKKD